MMNKRFGTGRGAVRLALSYLQLGAGLADVRRADPATISRLVFVCHGNICRSAIAEVIATGKGARAASFGLSTTDGRPADPVARQVGTAHGHDLDGHRATSTASFRPRPGDLLLAMEVRQLTQLAAGPFADYPRDLLGRWSGTPHIHDPYDLDPAYMETCLARIDRAVAALVTAFPGATPCG